MSRPNAELCCADSEGTAESKLFVWSSSNGGTSWMKYTKGTKSTVFGVKSAMVFKMCIQLRNVDYSGGDVANTQGESADFCCERLPSDARLQALDVDSLQPRHVLVEAD
ncbi:hypothetical protein DYB34_013271 [Aphanomyces astaci]|uniref:Uncharacterized protein n=1 Tax=Aphanomyces astaci TaxID=112090 RepID=A0A418C9S5_APHAT|nr:hypothetical protein DYB34_013271 [Aphanomyces astaci]